MVQRDQGIWIYSTRQRQQGHVCAHLCRGESRPKQPQRGCQGELRREGQPGQNVRGKSKSRLKRWICTKPAGSRRRVLSLGHRSFEHERTGTRDAAFGTLENRGARGCPCDLSKIAQLDQGTALPDQCLHSAEADVRPPRRKSGVDPSATSTGLKFRSVAVACAISFVPKRGKALSSQTAHGHRAPRPSVFAQDDGRRTEPATTELHRMVPRVGARPNAA
jgi:hypothetical protein